MKNEKAGFREGNLPFKYWGAHQDSNLGPAGYEPEEAIVYLCCLV